MEPSLSNTTSPSKKGLTVNKIILGLGAILVVVVIGAYALNSSPNVYKGSVAELNSDQQAACDAEAADGQPEKYIAGRGCVALSQLEAERIAQEAALAPIADIPQADGAEQNSEEDATPVDNNNDVVAVAENPVNEVVDPVAVTENAIGGPGGVTSASEEALFRVQMLEQQLAIKKANEAKAMNEELEAQAQKAREAEAAAFAAQARAARNKSLGITEPIVEPVVAPVSDAVVTPVENPVVKNSADPIIDGALAQPTIEVTKSSPEVTVTARESATQSAVVATKSNGLHGAAIRGETGPEILLYPAILGLTQGAYILIKRKK